MGLLHHPNKAYARMPSAAVHLAVRRTDLSQASRDKTPPNRWANRQLARAPDTPSTSLAPIKDCTDTASEEEARQKEKKRKGNQRSE